MPPVARIAEPRAPVLQRAFSVNSAIFRIHWTVDAKVLKSSDREKVSPPFEAEQRKQIFICPGATCNISDWRVAELSCATAPPTMDMEGLSSTMQQLVE
eukprot:symbB.v1.2.037054.t1/scaffold5246.1/size29401/1